MFNNLLINGWLRQFRWLPLRKANRKKPRLVSLEAPQPENQKLVPKLCSVQLSGTGSSLPSRVVPNEEFTQFLDTSDEWIITRTGIRERRYASPEEKSSTFAIQAAKRALIAANLIATDLDMIICATVTPDRTTPSTANLIQAGLGCRSIPSFDITAACTGFLYAWFLATQTIRAGGAKNVLVIGAEVLSRILDFQDRNTCILFGDGAGAVVLSQSEQGSPDRVHQIRLYSDGSKEEFIRIPSVATVDVHGVRPTSFLHMAGREVFKFAVHQMVNLMKQAMKDASDLGREIDLMVPHQVNQRIIDAALQATHFPIQKVMLNLDRYGNTSAASVSIALDEAIREGRIQSGQLVLLLAFGGGMTWGSILITV